MPTPAQHAEVESLMSIRSPVPSLDIRQRPMGPGQFSADSAIPGLNINPPQSANEPLDDAKRARRESEDGGDTEGFGGWISRLARRSRRRAGGAEGDRKGSDAGRYRRLEQDDE